MTLPTPFSEIVLSVSRSRGSALAHPVEPLAEMEYTEEIEAKNHALREFWKGHRLPRQPLPIVKAPRPRRYRTTTRRHALRHKGRLRLASYHGDDSGARPVSGLSLLDPREHIALYDFIEARLRETGFHALAGVLNYVIIRGSYVERSVIFNVCELSARIVRALTALGQLLPAFDKAVISSFIFLDPKRSRYYLDTDHIHGSMKTKKLFGPDILVVAFNGIRYLYYPTVFTQVNESMVPLLLSAARDLLCPAADQRLIDLYCGYGLFTHDLAPSYAHAYGLDASRRSIEAAERNARFHRSVSNASFRVAQIAGASFLRLLPSPGRCNEVMLADPPRQGMPAPVIAALSGRRPLRVLEACCGIEEVPGQIRAWQANGYGLTAALPLDMFAGTPHLETLLLFESGGQRRVISNQ